MIPEQCFTPTAQGWQRPTPEQVRDYLAGHSLSAYAAAPLIGVSKTTIQRWMTGDIAPKFADWSALVRAVHDRHTSLNTSD